MIHNNFRREGPHGDDIVGDVRIAEGPPPRSCIVMVHGFKGFKDWGFFPHASRTLAASGHALVSFNFSGNGIGEDGESFTELERFARNTLSREMEELHWIIDQVREGALVPRPAERVGLLGHSRGGAEAVLAARERDDVAALVTWAAVSSFDRWSEETLEEWRERGRVYVLNTRTGQQMPLDVSFLEDFEANRERFDVAAAAAEVQAPWLIVHGTRDLTVSVDEARTLARRAARPRLVLVEDAGHTLEASHPMDEPSPPLSRVLRDTERHFRQHL